MSRKINSTSAPNERVLRITQLAKLSFNHPSVVLTADVFQYFYKKGYRIDTPCIKMHHCAAPCGMKRARRPDDGDRCQPGVAVRTTRREELLIKEKETEMVDIRVYRSHFTYVSYTDNIPVYELFIFRTYLRPGTWCLVQLSTEM